MKLITTEASKLVVEFSRDELSVLTNALNEVCNGIEVPEFQTRIGVDLDEATGLLKQMGKALDTRP